MDTIEVINRLSPKAATYSAAIVAAMAKSGMTSKLEIAHFLAQIAHESEGLSVIEENLNYSAHGLVATFHHYFPNIATTDGYVRDPERIANRVYSSRMGNGDEESGDGYKYRGRGFIQLTGKNNYAACGKDLKIDLVNTPDLALEVDNLANIAVWFWEIRKCTNPAMHDDIVAVTKLINCGTTGLAERQSWLTKIEALQRS